MRCRRMWCAGWIIMLGLGCGQQPKPGGPGDAQPPKTASVADDPLLPVPPTGDDTSKKANAAAETAFAELLEATESSDPDAWTAAERKLTELGGAASPVLAKHLQDDNPLARELAVQFLAQLGSDAAGAEAALADALTDEFPSVRVNAASALLSISSTPDQAVAVLKELLSNDEATVRLTAAVSLTSVESLAEETLPVLTELLAASEWSVRLTAVQALGRLGAQAESSLTAVRRLAKDAQPEVRTAALAAARQIQAGKPAASDTIPASGVDESE